MRASRCKLPNWGVSHQLRLGGDSAPVWWAFILSVAVLSSDCCSGTWHQKDESKLDKESDSDRASSMPTMFLSLSASASVWSRGTSILLGRRTQEAHASHVLQRCTGKPRVASIHEHVQKSIERRERTRHSFIFVHPCAHDRGRHGEQKNDRVKAHHPVRALSSP